VLLQATGGCCWCAASWLLILIASWAVVRGLFEVVAATKLRKELTNEWVLILSGVLSIIFGALLFLNPAAGAMASESRSR
jgi:uncharacterized membrane protein HdeD (DUF308 family)